MTVLSLSPDIIAVYAPTAGVSDYGDPTYTWSQIYRGIPARVVYRSGIEGVTNGKEKVVPTHEIFVHTKYTIDETDRIVDQYGHTFDIINVNRLYNGTHMQIYARMIDALDNWNTDPYESSSSSSESSPSSDSTSSGLSEFSSGSSLS